MIVLTIKDEQIIKGWAEDTSIFSFATLLIRYVVNLLCKVKKDIV